MKAFAGAAAVLLLCAGCASVTQGTTQALRIETQTVKGEFIAGADCALNNDRGTTRAQSGQSSQIHRSSKDMEITCASPGLKDATARLVSRANAGLAGNILIGGAIGAMVDHNTGAAYSYPSWVRLVFGEYAVLDRKNEIDGSAMAAAPGSSSQVAARAEAVAPTAAAVQAAPVVAKVTAVPPAPPPIVAAIPAQPAVDASAKVPSSRLFRGNSFDYEVVDRETNKAQRVVLHVDRADANQVLFNGGARIEKQNGELIRVGSPLLGELDAVTPPRGWMSGGRLPQGSWPVHFTSALAGQRTSYDLTAHAGTEQRLRVKAGEFKAVRVDIEGWAERLEGLATARAHYEAVLWISPELRRVIRFEARSRSGGNMGGAYFSIDEASELTAVSSD